MPENDPDNKRKRRSLLYTDITFNLPAFYWYVKLLYIKILINKIFDTTPFFWIELRISMLKEQ